MNSLNSVPAKKKCILISTPHIGKFCPRGILSLASFLESKGYPAGVIPLSHYTDDDDLSPEKIESVLKDLIRENDPLMIGVSCLTADYHTCVEILKTCKQVNKNIVTVMGGIHPTFLDEECISPPFTDIVVRGEGEWTLLELIRALENGGFHPPYGDLHKIHGLTFKENGHIVRTPDRELGNLHELPPLDFGLLPDAFVRQASVMGMMSRGCAFDCYFCADKPFWKYVRQFPMSHIIHEMETLSRSYKNPMMGIEDNMVYIGSDRFSELCMEIKQRKIALGSHFHVQTRVDSISGEQGLKDMQGTGIRHVVLGIESGSPKVLKLMNKKTNPEMIIAACEKLREYDVASIGVWMIGYPGDSPHEQHLTLELLETLLKRDLLKFASFSYFIPWPGTRFYAEPEKYGIEVLVKNRADWYYYEKEGKRNPICQLKGFSAEEMSACYQKGFEMIAKYNAMPFWKRESGAGGTRSISFKELT